MVGARGGGGGAGGSGSGAVAWPCLSPTQVCVRSYRPASLHAHQQARHAGESVARVCREQTQEDGAAEQVFCWRRQ